MNSFQLVNPDDEIWKNRLFTSKVKVTVKNSMINVISSFKAAEDLKEQHGYRISDLPSIHWHKIETPRQCKRFSQKINFI